MKVLIVRIGAMGDVLHALPAVAAMRRAHPDWQIDWVVDERWRGLLAADGAETGPVVDRVVAVGTRAWNRRPFSPATLRSVLGLRRGLLRERYDLCVDLQGTIRSAVIGRMAGACRFVGPKEPREGPAMRLYGETIETLAVHVIGQAGEILGYAAGGIGELVHEQAVPVGLEEESWAQEVISRTAGVKGIVVMAPTAGWRSKEWPAERFGELAGRLAEEGWGVLVNAPPAGSVSAGGGSPLGRTAKKAKANANTGIPRFAQDDSMQRSTAAGELETTAEVVVRASGGRAAVVPCTIGQLASLLRRARLFVGGDTGPMHLADALGVPVVALFGPTDPARTGPVGERVRVLRHGSSVTDHRRYATTEAGLGRITVEEAYRAARELLEEGDAGNGRNADSLRG